MQYLTKFGHKKARTLDNLTRSFRIDSNKLQDTIREYNETIANKEPDPLRKEDEYRSPVVTPPFYRIDISIRDNGLLLMPAITLGGLRVDGATGLMLK